MSDALRTIQLVAVLGIAGVTAYVVQTGSGAVASATSADDRSVLPSTDDGSSSLTDPITRLAGTGVAVVNAIAGNEYRTDHTFAEARAGEETREIWDRQDVVDQIKFWD